MYEYGYLAAPLAFIPCKRCGRTSFYDRVADAFVCIGCGNREEIVARRPVEFWRKSERMRRAEPVAAGNGTR
ncbi:MAG TPA: hypothetical protein VNN10_05190 [Dehalococcoidia bacterium]|nr:hypothetical protein [Dehalococcoidia bacterium]